MKFKFLISFLLSFLFLSTFLTTNSKAQSSVYLTLFYSNSCPHCAKEKVFLEELEEKYSWLKITQYEVTDKNNVDLFIQTADTLGIQASGVPVTIICDEYFVGYSDDPSSKNQIEQLITDCAQKQTCPNLIEQIINQHNLITNPSHTPQPDPIDQEASNSANLSQCPDHDQDCTCQDNDKLTQLRERDLQIPLLGTYKIKDFSLPALTFIIALLDGFNPCAMWVLLFLISMLLGMKDKKRMWLLGFTFIVASGFVYFLFLSAWLNMFLFIGYVKLVQVAIGIFAFAAGSYYLYDYLTNKDGACHVTGNEKRQKVFEKIKNITQNQNLIMAMIGIILLAFAVNLVELLCSAGLPAIYTQLLTLSQLPTWQYYAYLLFYITIFMIDDLFVFFIAMTTLQTTGISSKYSRLSHLIGGFLMLAIGLAMVFKPELLMFG